ncbi:MAG: S46 family peptidase [Candidatus Cryptobacteroides sp.]
MKKSSILAALLLCLSVPLSADEGMWMVNSLSSQLVQKMQKMGLELEGNTIYNTDSLSLSSAIVSMNFIGTGSMISSEGLLITNHHVAYSDIHGLSTAEHNYLEDGFWARSREEEIPIPGKSVQFLVRILDVSEEVEKTRSELETSGVNAGMRKLSHIIEQRWKAETGLEASLSSMWAGSKYYLSLYREYTDVRLVAAPPVSIAAFGGDIDNWEWPQHKGDFVLYRVYDSDGKPITPAGYLNISPEGYELGDFTMVLGYPGRTDRYSSSAKVHYLTTLSLPISNRVRADQMSIIKGWMDKDNDIRLLYADKFFTLSNIQENQEGEVLCSERFNIEKSKRKEEKRMGRGRQGRGLRELNARLDSTYTAIRQAEANLIWFRETLIRGSALNLVATRLKNSRKPLDMDKEYSAFDLRVEKDLFRYNMKAFYENVEPKMWGEYQTALYSSHTIDGETDWDAMFEHLWIEEKMTKDSPIYLFLTDRSVQDFNKEVEKAYGELSVSDLGREYTRQSYRYKKEKKIDQYPDANSTLRLSYGKVSTFPRDGQMLAYQTFASEILLKENESYDFRLKDDWRALLRSQAETIPVNFITDNDITGGNSGSPVLNGRGEVIGLAFDGNKESLASDLYYVEGYTKCVCVDIRYILWILKHYAQLDYILEELQLTDSEHYL